MDDAVGPALPGKRRPGALRRLVTADALARIGLGWLAVVVLGIAGPHLEPPVPVGTLVAATGGIVAVIVVCAFGVVRQAEALARRLGDPYGSLVLTLSIVLIEVILIAAVMLGPGEHATIGRDSVMAVSMIILNLVIGLSLVAGGRRHGVLRVNRRGTVAYLTMITGLGALGFAVPRWIGRHGSYTAHQELPVIVGAAVAYAVFLVRQTVHRADDFREVRPGGTDRGRTSPGPVGGSDRRDASVGRRASDGRGEVPVRLGVLVVTMVPIVLLSHDMAALLDDGLDRLGAPVALTGMLIALIVFLPEGLTSVRAALAGEPQRVSNLCHGALVSTLALTIPAVLGIGLVTGGTVVLAESTTNLVLLALTVAWSWITFTSRRITVAHGVAHLALFAVYAVTLVT